MFHHAPRQRIFYGWWIVLTAAFGLCLGPPVAVFSFGVFFKSLVSDFHATRAAISFAFTLHNVVSALWMQMAGRLIDRYGPRRIILPSIVIYALILFSGTLLGSSIWQFYLFYAALGLATSGTGPVPYAVVVSRWFNRRRGLALGFMMLGVGIGSIVVPLAAQRLIAAFGWRLTYGIFGGAVLLLALPVVAALLLNDPAERGLLPDGAEAGTLLPEPQREQEGLSWTEIWHRPEFWRLVTVFFLTGASVHAGVLHMPALLTDRGLSVERAALVTALIGLSLTAGRLGAGFLLDRFSGPHIAMLFYGASALGLGILWSGSAGTVALLAACLVGIGMGSEADIIGYLLSRYFGLRAFGTAFGYAFGSFVLAGAVGTLLMGAGFDLTQSYSVPLAGFFIAMAIAIGLLRGLGPYRYAADAAHAAPPARAHLASAGRSV
jgi:MFS family permease